MPNDVIFRLVTTRETTSKPNSKPRPNCVRLSQTALVDFIRAERGVSAAETITAQTRLQDDLGVYGDDATDLLFTYAKTFHMDVSQLMAADYFDAEGLDVLAWFRLVKARRK